LRSSCASWAYVRWGTYPVADGLNEPGHPRLDRRRESHAHFYGLGFDANEHHVSQFAAGEPVEIDRAGDIDVMEGVAARVRAALFGPQGPDADGSGFAAGLDAVNEYDAFALPYLGEQVEKGGAGVIQADAGRQGAMLQGLDDGDADAVVAHEEVSEADDGAGSGLRMSEG